jgi:hypothetical protein
MRECMKSRWHRSRGPPPSWTSRLSRARSRGILPVVCEQGVDHGLMRGADRAFGLHQNADLPDDVHVRGVHVAGSGPAAFAIDNGTKAMPKLARTSAWIQFSRDDFCTTSSETLRARRSSSM